MDLSEEDSLSTMSEIPQVNQFWKFAYLKQSFIAKVISVKKLDSHYRFRVQFEIDQVITGETFKAKSLCSEYFPSTHNARMWTRLSKLGSRTACRQCR